MKNNAIERLNKVLISDKYINPESIVNVMRSDMVNIAINYLDFEKDNALTKLEINKDGSYNFILKINAKRIKGLGILPKQY